MSSLHNPCNLKHSLQRYKIATFISIPFFSSNAHSLIPPTSPFMSSHIQRKDFPLSLKTFPMSEVWKWVEICSGFPDSDLLLNCAVKGTSNVLQLGLSIVTSVPASNILSFATIVTLYCLVFVLNTICLILEYFQAIKWQRQNATLAMKASAERENRLLSLY
jgi:hypothetical protein